MEDKGNNNRGCFTQAEELSEEMVTWLSSDRRELYPL